MLLFTGKFSVRVTLNIKELRTMRKSYMELSVFTVRSRNKIDAPGITLTIAVTIAETMPSLTFQFRIDRVPICSLKYQKYKKDFF